jgi:acyl-coenzyme A thioesterase PaaI-like protein
MAVHSEFLALPWVRSLLTDRSIQIREEVSIETKSKSTAPNRMFTVTLFRPGAISQHLSFKRACSEGDAIGEYEECMLLSLGHDVDGKHGRAHGGLDSLVLDTILGATAHHAVPSRLPPATATLTVDFHRPVNTPGVILARAWLLKITGRKIWVRGVLEDGEGKALASGKALFIVPLDSAL